MVQIQRPRRAGSVYCEEARRLLDVFGEAVHELVEIHQQQFDAIVQGDNDFNRFDLLIHMANEKKYTAKTHVAEHGCSIFHETNKG